MKTSYQQIALYGGSFDPPHIGHQAIIKAALSLAIDRLFVIPAFLNPFKDSSLFSPTHRLDLIAKIATHPKITISSYEINEQKPTPTIMTLHHLKQHYNFEQALLLLGADHLPRLMQWHNYEQLAMQVKFVIIPRDGFYIGPQYQILPMPPINISSTQIRKQLKNHDLSALEFIPQILHHDIILFCKEHFGKSPNNH